MDLKRELGYMLSAIAFRASWNIIKGECEVLN